MAYRVSSEGRPPTDRARSGSRHHGGRRTNDDDDDDDDDAEYSRTRLVEGGAQSRVDDIRRTTGGGSRNDGKSRTTETGNRRKEPHNHRTHHGRTGKQSGHDLTSEIETLTSRLKTQLANPKSVPWDRTIEKTSRQLRTAFVLLLFEHYTSPLAQGIDQVWMTTSYWLISAFRTMIADVEKKVAAATAGTGVGAAGDHEPRYQYASRRNDTENRDTRAGDNKRDRETLSGPVELRKLLQRFQRFLTSEIGFYHSLIRKLVKRFDLLGRHVNSVELKGYLEMLGEGLETSDADVVDTDEGGDGVFASSSSPTGNDANGQPLPRDQDQRLVTLDFSTLHLSREETHKKLSLVHKSLICLGDISRYKDLYGPERERKRLERVAAQGGHGGGGDLANRGGGGGRRNGKAGSAAVGMAGRLKDNEERFRRAKQYYMVAKGFMPDNGNPFNQLAVISVEVGDTFDAVYHYHRALACSAPFKSAGHNLRRSLDKAKRDWSAYVSERKATSGDWVVVFEELAKGREVGMFKNEEVVMQAIDGHAEVSGPELIDSHLDHLAMLIKDRLLPSADIVKTVVLALAADWNTMMDQIPPSSSGKAGDDPNYYLVYCLAISQTVCQAALEEVQSCLAPELLDALANDHSVPIPASTFPVENGEAAIDINLSVNITAALRRILPVLRIISKWLKGNIARLVRAEQDGGKVAEEVEIFASTYMDLLRHMEALFPLEQLPKLYDPLEEDYDMKGFSPVKRGMMESSEADEAGGAAARHSADVHPNEEQLMRISDILLDGKLILFQSEAKVLFGLDQTAARLGETHAIGVNVDASNAQLANLHLYRDVTVQAMPSSFAPPDSRRIDVDVEVASVGAETEDDPVNMAMRATMTDGSSLEDEDRHDKDFDDEEEEEQMVWGGRNASTPPAAADLHAHGLRTGTSSTATDLLHTLIHGPTAGARNSQTSSPTHRASFVDSSRPLPNRLFGGNFGSIWAPAFGEMNVAGDMARSRSGSGAGFPRVQRDSAHSPSIWGHSDIHRTPQQDASNSFASGSDSERHNAPGDFGQTSYTPFG
ncbi:hypothetical protein QFC21_004681 [Naganishia friedmannii]|uniref:Uncharacterized protein n=1 Tax=Naganishia friedmannii TaxID=89922 RepID=A0ACC2VE18_9TREE|nr:hypothetical protein QFC21_004681 [Naganishia friedmannii]